MDCFDVFLDSKVITFIQPSDSVYLIFSFEIYSFVINIAIDVNRAVLLGVTIPTLESNSDKVLDVIADPDPVET